MGKYLYATTDISFKKLFANEHNIDLTIAFLNNVLGLTGRREIVKLELKDPVNKPDRAGGKEIIFDVYCKDTKNNHYIIEMQASNEYNFYERSQGYIARALGNQLKSCDNYLEMVPVIFVGVVNYSLKAIKKYKRADDFKDQSIITLQKNGITQSESTQVISKYSFINHLTHEIIPAPLMELNYVELPHFNKSLEECHTEIDKWLYLIKTIHNFQEVPASFKKSKNFVQACQSLEEKNWEKGELEAYVKEMDDIGKEDRIKEGAREEGLEQGIAEGIAKGIEKGIEVGIEKGIEKGARKEKEAIAINLLKMKVSIDMIAQSTALSVQEVESLKKSLK